MDSINIYVRILCIVSVYAGSKTVFVLRTKCIFTMGAVLAKLLQIFWTKKLDIVVIGLENRYVVV